ncbi:hypothetical protein HY629_00805 [Candidatus Uhrbacteria bacterium]|nr:hypothetical protein [Candidatus Uhrbacteria bacterium]
MGWTDLLVWRRRRGSGVAPSVCMKPGMGGTTIDRPTPPEIIVALFTASRFRVMLQHPFPVNGEWTIDPHECTINDDESEIRFIASVGGSQRPVRIPLDTLVECDPDAYGHTKFQLPFDGTPLKAAGYRCYRSREPKDKDHSLIILAWPSTDLPRVPSEHR